MKGKWLFRLLGVGGVLVASALLFKANHCVFVNGHSMDPTFHNLQILSYNPNATITKNCVVVFKMDNDTLIKRVTYIPGEFYRVHVEPDGRRWPVYLDSDEYFVEGDNSDASDDSRDYGPITKDQILGVVPNVPTPEWWKESPEYFKKMKIAPKPQLKVTAKLVHSMSYYRAFAADDGDNLDAYTGKK